ncbi:MAG: hypothetical protein LQ343_003632 [Gyalolechia ehrenbergii]|nr:MAG: hypothetical protein LQ343_003632 [Gyalolechia ehrenbergii]
MTETNHSSLLSNNKSSDSSLQIHLHPLVLLTVSDHITRHTLRRRQELIVGALLGQHNGRDITLEHAFECQVVRGEQGAVLLHQAWFEDRLQQFKDVHKDPALELVGWFTTAPATGPELQHVPIHQQILQEYNETAVLLAFHPTDVLAGATQGGKLPLTIYESVYEGAQGLGKAATYEADGDRSMEIDASENPLDLKFRELPYSVDTGEAEMIGVDFVARGGGNATHIDAPAKQKGKEKSSKDAKSQQETKTLNDASLLSPEDEEREWVTSEMENVLTWNLPLPPSYLSDISVADGTMTDEAPTLDSPEVNHSILRSIQALINRLPILVPADSAAFEQESLAEKSDVSLVTLLGDLTRGTKNIREMGRKFGIVNHAKQRQRPGRALAQMHEDTDEQFVEQMTFTD